MNKTIPEIRFEGFTDDWEQRKLSEIAEFNPKSNLPDRFEYVDLESVIGTKMIYHRTENKVSAPSRAQRLAQKGDVFYQTVRPYQKNNYLFDLPFNNYVFSTGYAQMRPKNNSYFLLTLLQEEKFVNRVLERSTGTSYPAINSNDLAKISVDVPIENKEEVKIGMFFKQLDDTIALHQRQLEYYQKLKKAMLQKMFPEKGAKIPKIRFNNFTEKWEQRKLGELVKITTGKLDANAMVENGKYDFYTSGIKKYKINTHAFKGPAITIAGNGATVGYMHYANGLFNAYQRTYVLNNFIVNREFLFQAIGNTLPKKIKQEARTGNIPYIVMSMLTDLNIKAPSSKEQKQIGILFTQLDDTITLHQKKAEELERVKKYFLKKMFI